MRIPLRNQGLSALQYKRIYKRAKKTFHILTKKSFDEKPLLPDFPMPCHSEFAPMRACGLGIEEYPKPQNLQMGGTSCPRPM
jgi:hypothetical protein